MWKKLRLQDHHSLSGVCLWLASLWLPLLGFGQSYSITDLGTLGGSYSEAHGLNIKESVVGDWDPGASPYVRGFLFANGTNSDLPTLGGVYATAYAINDTNAVVGESTVVGAFSDIHAFRCYGGTISDLGTLGGSYPGGYSSAHAVNALGQIVGESSLSVSQPGVTHAVLFSGGTRTDLGVAGGDYSSAKGINDSGAIVGETSVVSQNVTNIHAFVYTNGAIHDLGTLGGAYSSARGVNNSGVIVGESEIVPSPGVTNLSAFVCPPNGPMTGLDTSVFGGKTSSAAAVNSAGSVVGYAYDAGGTSFAFLYTGSRLLNLIEYIPANSGWTNLTTADAINDAGQIAGSGLLTNGAYHAFLLTPVVGSLSLCNPIALTNGQFQLTVQGTAGLTFALEASPDFVNWSGLCTNTLAGTTPTNLIDAGAATNGWRFYRARLLR